MFEHLSISVNALLRVDHHRQKDGMTLDFLRSEEELGSIQVVRPYCRSSLKHLQRVVPQGHAEVEVKRVKSDQHLRAQLERKPANTKRIEYERRPRADLPSKEHK